MAKEKYLDIYYDNKKCLCVNWDKIVTQTKTEIEFKSLDQLESLKWEVIAQKANHDTNVGISVYSILFAVVPVLYMTVFYLIDSFFPGQTTDEMSATYTGQFIVVGIITTLLFLAIFYLVRFDIKWCRNKERFLEIKIQIIEEAIKKMERKEYIELYEKQKIKSISLILDKMNKSDPLKKCFIRWWNK